MKKILIVALSLFSMASIASSDFNYAAYTGTYQLIAHHPHGACELNYHRPLTLSNSPKENFVQGTFSNGSYIKMKNINKGRIKFDSCHSNGTIGHTTTTGNATRVQEKIVYLKPGRFCRGGKENYSIETSWELKGDLLILTSTGILTSTRPALADKIVCQFKKVQE